MKGSLLHLTSPDSPGPHRLAAGGFFLPKSRTFFNLAPNCSKGLSECQRNSGCAASGRFVALGVKYGRTRQREVWLGYRCPKELRERRACDQTSRRPEAGRSSRRTTPG